MERMRGNFFSAVYRVKNFLGISVNLEAEDSQTLKKRLKTYEKIYLGMLPIAPAGAFGGVMTTISILSLSPIMYFASLANQCDHILKSRVGQQFLTRYV